jgi:hypothetical protein
MRHHRSKEANRWLGHDPWLRLDTGYPVVLDFVLILAAKGSQSRCSRADYQPIPPGVVPAFVIAFFH